MSASRNDPTPNLKHRLTGAVILVVLAVAVMSMLLDTDSPGVAPAPVEQGDDGFVSRIVSTDGENAVVPAPATPPPELEAADADALGVLSGRDDAPATAPPAAEPAASVAPPAAPAPPTKPASPASTPLVVEPVLRQDTRMPRPAPRINTVQAEEKPAPRSTEVAAATRPQRAPAASESWVVRVGAFSDRTNAEGISQRLSDGGFTPASAPINVNGKTMIRVWVGPYPDRVAATRAKSEIARIFKINGFVVRQE